VNDQLASGGKRLRRRTVVGMGVAMGALSLGLALPGAALAQQAQPAALGMPLPGETVAETLQRLFGGRTLQPAGDRIRMEAPMIAENGAVVPIRVESTLPMAPDNYVRRIYLIADKNRRPLNASFSLSPASGRAALATNIRLAETSDVRVIAEMSNGALFEAKQEVKVTVGGCGG